MFGIKVVPSNCPIFLCRIAALIRNAPHKLLSADRPSRASTPIMSTLGKVGNAFGKEPSINERMRLRDGRKWIFFGRCEFGPWRVMFQRMKQNIDSVSLCPLSSVILCKLRRLALLTIYHFFPSVNTPHFLTIKGVEVNAGQTASFHCTVNGRKRDNFRLWLQVSVGPSIRSSTSCESRGLARPRARPYLL